MLEGSTVNVMSPVRYERRGCIVHVTPSIATRNRWGAFPSSLIVFVASSAPRWSSLVLLWSLP
jgi:hypothetical protein